MSKCLRESSDINKNELLVLMFKVKLMKDKWLNWLVITLVENLILAESNREIKKIYPILSQGIKLFTLV